MTAKDIMTKDPACCTYQTTLHQAAGLMCEHDCGEIPVVDNMRDKRPIGVITDRDMVCRAVMKGIDPSKITVGECMTEPCVTVVPETTLEECCHLMEKKQLRRIPVVDAHGGLCGIVSQADIVLKANETEAAKLVKEVSEPQEIHQAKE